MEAQKDPKGSPKKKSDDSNKHSSGGGSTSTGLFLYGLCTFSMVVSMYTTYRGGLLEGRMADLEMKFANLQGSVIEPSEVLMMRLKREVEEKFQRRIAREAVSTGRRLLVAELEQQQADGKLASLLRLKRDLSDCNCPPGEFCCRWKYAHFIKNTMRMYTI